MHRFRPVFAATVLAAAIAVPSAVGAQSSTSPGAPLPGSERDDVVVTLVDAGDPSTATVLRVPYTVGAVATYEQQWSDRGSETYQFDGTSSSSDWELDLHTVGTDEVLVAADDGSARVRFAQDVVSQRVEYSNPEHGVGGDFALTPLDGTVADLEYGPSRHVVAAYEVPEQPLTDEQAAHLVGTGITLGVVVPAEAVGVGATWTWSTPAELFGVGFELPLTARLDAVDGDRYTVTVDFEIDLPTASGLVLPDGIVAVSSGTYSGSRTVEGALSNPLDQHHTEETVYSAVVELSDDVVYEGTGVSIAVYTSSPNDG